MKHIIKLFIAIMAFSSCTDLKDKVYSDLLASNFPENARQADQIAFPAYAKLQSHVDGGWWFGQELTGDLIVAPTRAGDWDDGGKWRVLHTHKWDNKNETVQGMWGNFYAGVTECNKAIEYLGTAATATNTIAQMRVLRAYYNYLLIDNYGSVPYITSFSNAPKLPLKSPRDSIFNAIIGDIKASIPNLSGTAKSAVNKYTAYALLAKLYLNAQIYTGTPMWQEAENYCDSVIAGPYHLESNRLAPFVTQNELSPENIFTIPYDEDNYQGFILHNRTLHYNSSETFDAKTGFWNGFCTQEKLVDLFEVNDTRNKALLVGQQYSSSGTPLVDVGASSNLIFTKQVPALNMTAALFTSAQIRMSGARMVKFEVKKGVKFNLSNDYPIFRLADFILMKAECELRKGNVPSAKSLINQIRVSAGVTAWNDVDITLDNLLDERAREMWCEAHRRQDLIRFNKFKNSWWEKDADSEINYVFPIPQTAIDSNPNLAK